MKTLKEQFIIAVVEEAVRRSQDGATVRVLDLGCGTANYVPSLVAKFPTIEYVGVEPIDSSYQAALKNLEGIEKAKVHFQLGYDSVPNEAEASFDVVFSLSVLEHIKQLGRFLALGVKYTKSGGLIVHRYDLGHALHTHSLKEWIHVKLGNHFPAILPERQFVRYLAPSEVEGLYEKQGVKVLKTTYHQMSSHKALEKHLKQSETTAIDELFAWEMKHQGCIDKVPQKDKEKLFPAIAVWGEKSPGDFSQDLAS
jgi:SAM-dependent methyltransferase